MSRKVLIVLLFGLLLNFQNVYGRPIEGVVIDDGGDGGGTVTYTDYEADTFYYANYVSMNSSTRYSFTNGSDEDWFKFTAPYNGRIRIYTTGYRNTTIRVHNSTAGYNTYFPTTVRASSTYYDDHTDAYNSTDLSNFSTLRARSAVNYRYSNGYVTMYMQKGQTYYIELENDTDSAGYYYLKIQEDAYCINDDISNYTKLLINGVTIFNDNFDSFGSDGMIDYRYFGTNSSNVYDAARIWNNMSDGAKFRHDPDALLPDLIVIEVSDLPADGFGVYLNVDEYVEMYNILDNILPFGINYYDILDLFADTTNVHVILISLADTDLGDEYTHHVAHEMGHALGFGDMYNTVPGEFSNLEGRMNMMEGNNSMPTQTGFCDQYIYNQLFN